MKRTAFLFLALILFLCGCSSESLTNNVLGATATYADRETKIQNNIESLDGIYKAYVVIRGKAALIGIVLEKEYADKAYELKILAAQKARTTDLEIKSTAVTCNPEITDMIQNLKNIER